MKMELGADRKKLAWLAGLLVLAGIAYYINRDSGDVPAAPRPTSGAAATTAPKVALRPVSRVVRPQAVGRNSKNLGPNMKPKEIDPTKVDPTIHLDLLAKVRDVKVEPSTRSLFEILNAPPPPPAALIAAKEPDKIPIPKLMVGPKPKPPDPPPPPEPRAPKIPLKFYGFVNPARPDIKRAFFLDGEEIVIAGEGEMVKKRYKIVRIGVNSAEVEDTTFKGTGTKQTLPLEAEAANG